MTLDTVITLGTSWLLTYAIHSTILILGVWLVVRGIPPLASRIGPRGENLAWKFALVGGLVSASVQVGAGIHPALGALELGRAEPVTRAQPVEPASVAVASTQRLGRIHPLGRMHAKLDEIERVARATKVMFVTRDEVKTLAAVPPPPTPWWPKLVFGLALLGAALALVRLGLCIRTLRRKLGDRSEVLVDPALEQFLSLCSEAQVDRKVRLTHTAALGSPIALGRSEVVVPTRALDELSPTALRSVLAHELAHLERRDPAWLLVAATIEALCFFQPLNRLARRGMQESAELLCDDWAIAQTRDGVEFAKSLAELASWSHRMQPSALVAGMISGERPLVRRVRRALDGDPRRLHEEGPRPARLLLGLGTLAALVMLAPGAVDASPPETEPSEPSKPSKIEQRRSLRIEDRLERDANKARERAERARAKAERASEEAREAEREAHRAERALRQPIEVERDAGIGRSIVIRDGDDFLIIDERGLRAGEGDDRFELDERGVHIHHEGHEFDLDLDKLDGLDGLDGLPWHDLGRALEQLSGQGDPSSVPGVFDPEEFEPTFDKLDKLGDAIEERIEREIRVELDGLDGLEGLEGLLELEGLDELEQVEGVLRWLDQGRPATPPRPALPQRPAPAPPAPSATPISAPVAPAPPAPPPSA